MINFIAYLPYIICGFVLVFFFFVLYLISDTGPTDKIDLTNPDTHVIVTGGSSGVGLSTALLLREHGCTVTIISRDRKKLEETKRMIDSQTKSTKGSLNIESADVSNRDQITAAINRCCVKMNGRCDILILSAGVSRPGYIDEVAPEMIEKQMSINYLGSLYSAIAVLPIMKSQRYGRIIFISSLAGLAATIGFGAYSPSKFAVRGLAEVLAMELKPYNIYTTLVNPPDVDTPMLAEEMQWKPLETKLISSDGGMFQPEDIARDIIDAIKNWKFMVNTGFDGWLLGVLSTGISTPSPSAFRSMAEIFLAGPLRFVGLVYLFMWNRICKQVDLERREKETTTTTPNSIQDPILR